MMRCDLPPSADETAQFWKDIRDITSAVLALTKHQPSVLSETPECVGLLLQERGLNPQRIRERLLCHTAQLVDFDLPNRTETSNEFVRTWLNATAQACLSERAATQKPIPLVLDESKPGYSQLIEARGNEVLMETLTAAWLGLYFLGIPFVHPWERVRRLTDDCGGFPSGACVTKYIGDLYRMLRQRMVRELTNDNERYAAQALVLSYAPSVLLQHLLERDEDNITPPSPHVLGRCYALLQLRLYIGEGFPITYFVSEQLVRNDPPQPGFEHVDHIEEMRLWLNTNFRNPCKGQSVLLLKPELFPLGIPTCVLASRAGIYVLDTKQHPVPFAGNLIRAAMLTSYREKLTDLKSIATVDSGAGKVNLSELLGRDKTSFAEVLCRH